MDRSAAGSDFYDAMTRTLEFSPDAALKFSGGVRAFIMSASTIADLVDDFYLVLGERFVDARLYLGGKRAGKRTAAALTAKYDLKPDDKATAEQFFADFYTSLGWANLEFQLDYAHRAGGVIAHNSFLAQGATAKFTARGNATAVETALSAPRCAMLSGYIAGLVSHLFEADIDARETECIAMNAPACRFHLAESHRAR